MTEALKYAYLLLKYRQRSTAEMRQRLARRRFSSDTVEAVIRILTEKAFLDDQRFARLWSESRLNKGFGARRVVGELRAKGISQQFIERCLQDFFSSAAESAAVRDLARARLKKMRGLERRLRRARLAGYLIRRGFSPDIVWECVSEL